MIAKNLFNQQIKDLHNGGLMEMIAKSGRGAALKKILWARGNKVIFRSKKRQERMFAEGPTQEIPPEHIDVIGYLYWI